MFDHLSVEANALFPTVVSQSFFAHRSGEIDSPHAWVGLSVSKVVTDTQEEDVTVLTLTLDEAKEIGRGLLWLTGDPVPVASRGSWDAAYARAEDDGPVDLDWYVAEVLPDEYLSSGLPVAATY